MTYIKDLMSCTYHRGEIPTHLAVGWLDISQPFTTGNTTEEFKTKLEYLTTTQATQQYRGSHGCQWCSSGLMSRYAGNGSIRVISPVTQNQYEAPVLIAHYVRAHNYLPPEDFIVAVMSQN